MKKVQPKLQITKYSPLTISRSHVLGGIYARCERLATKCISVYLNNPAGEKLGVVDESHGQYADAFTFYLSEENCKMLARGKYDYFFDYQLCEPASATSSRSKRPIQLVSMYLTARKTYDTPELPRQSISAIPYRL
jgi:hypothetical protein